MLHGEPKPAYSDANRCLLWERYSASWTARRTRPRLHLDQRDQRVPGKKKEGEGMRGPDSRSICLSASQKLRTCVPDVTRKAGPAHQEHAGGKRVYSCSRNQPHLLQSRAARAAASLRARGRAGLLLGPSGPKGRSQAAQVHFVERHDTSPRVGDPSGSIKDSTTNRRLRRGCVYSVYLFYRVIMRPEVRVRRPANTP